MPDLPQTVPAKALRGRKASPATRHPMMERRGTPRLASASLSPCRSNGFSVPVPEGDEKEVEERKMPTSSTVIDDANRGVQLEVLIEGAGPDVILVPSALRGASDFAVVQDPLGRAGDRTI